MQFKYKGLLKPVLFDSKEELHALSYLMSLLVDDYDFRDVLLIGKTFCNMGIATGLSITRYVKDILNANLDDFEPDEQLLVFAEATYNSDADHLGGACFVLTPLDMQQLKLNIAVLPPDRVIKRIHKDKPYILYFYRMLPLGVFMEESKWV